MAGKALQAIQCARLLEGLGLSEEAVARRVAANAARGFFSVNERHIRIIPL